jgi:hypothetical protein
MERHGLLDDQFVRIEHLLRVVPARWVATAIWAIDFSSRRAMPGISRYILAKRMAYAAVSVRVEIGTSRSHLALPAMSSPRWAGDTQSNP